MVWLIELFELLEPLVVAASRVMVPAGASAVAVKQMMNLTRTQLSKDIGRLDWGDYPNLTPMLSDKQNLDIDGKLEAQRHFVLLLDLNNILISLLSIKSLSQQQRDWIIIRVNITSALVRYCKGYTNEDDKGVPQLPMSSLSTLQLQRLVTMLIRPLKQASSGPAFTVAMSAGEVAPVIKEIFRTRYHNQPTSAGGKSLHYGFANDVRLAGKGASLVQVADEVGKVGSHIICEGWTSNMVYQEMSKYGDKYSNPLKDLIIDSSYSISAMTSLFLSPLDRITGLKSYLGPTFLTTEYESLREILNVAPDYYKHYAQAPRVQVRKKNDNEENYALKLDSLVQMLTQKPTGVGRLPDNG